MSGKKSSDSPKAPLPFNRTAQMGVTGTEASTIGFVLVGCIGVGFFAGNWLDGRMGTSFWMPLGVLLGIVAGFREMLVTVKRLSARQAQAKFLQKAEREAQNQLLDAQNAQNLAPKPLFQVPAPPFERQTESSAQTEESHENLMEQLLRGELHDEEIEALPPDIRQRLGLEPKDKKEEETP